MKRALLIAGLCLWASHASADVTTAWVRQLQTDGYDEISIGRTWLGRTRIVAEKDDLYREIILNTATGEVLRDYSRAADGGPRLPLGFDHGLDDDDDDDNDDDDYEDEDEDDDDDEDDDEDDDDDDDDE